MVLLMSVMIIPSTVSAEQAAAEQYRQMFRNGNFYVECQIFATVGSHNMSSGNLIYAGKNGSRMQRTTATGNFSLSLAPSYFWYSELSNFKSYVAYDRSLILNPMQIGNNSRIHSSVHEKSKNYPDVMYKNGRYYRIKSEVAARATNGFGFNKKSKIFALVLPEDKLGSPYLNPDEEWQYIKQDLALPDELAIFYWEDKFHQNPFGVKPYYNGSTKRTIDEKEYDCDQYLIDIKSMAGTIIAQEAYNMLYENDKLVMIQKYLLRDGKEKLVRTTKIGTITSEVPEEFFKINQKCKIYAAGTGDMNELIDKKVIVEEIGGKEKK